MEATSLRTAHRARPVYLSFSGISTRGSGGAFKIEDKIFIGGKSESFELRKQVIAGREFDLDFTGEGMRSEDPGHAQGPRLKVVAQGFTCSNGHLPMNFTGLQCQQPAGSSVLAGVICTTPPNKATTYLHRWRKLTINSCGDFQLCHCNEKCDMSSNWKRAGVLEARPALNLGTMEKPMPGCEAYMPTMPPEGSEMFRNENRSNGLLSTYLSVSGGLTPSANILQAVQGSLAIYLSTTSVLLAQQVPDSNEVTITEFQGPAGGRRLRASGPRALQPVTGSDCIDDDAVFAAEAAKVSFPLQSCAEAFKFVQQQAAGASVCGDATLQKAFDEGCRLSCGLCEPATTPGPSTTAGPTIDPGLAQEQAVLNSLPSEWPGGSSALKIFAKVRFRTDATKNVFESRILQMKTDASHFLTILYQELGKAGLEGADLPSQLGAHVVADPFVKIDPAPLPREETTSTTTAPPKLSMNSVIIIAAASAIGGGCLLSCLVVLLWLYATREQHEVDAGTESKTITEVSEGGYRFKKKVIPGTAPVVKPPEPSLCQRCWENSPCVKLLCPKKQIRRVAPVDEENLADASHLTIGSRVRLMGLSKAHFNGLEGYITGGPNDKGRFTVDVIVDDDDSVRELQTLSFKPENLRRLPPEFANDANIEAAKASLEENARGPSSYRNR
eukprot:TRINITY_DN10916_c0_g1_i2.p1 TRINITY_DN10916_c0_g1~~TRINITY_DN10916_c0_g1_i2.p1  ORF type:complete len:670 (+),score=120.71 TRINITY_DN10916_c0_g1_i2:86-2095(+)